MDIRKIYTYWLLLCATCCFGQTHIHISNPETWTTDELSMYVGKNVIFDEPMYVVDNYNSISVAPKRLFAPNNQAHPNDANYATVVRNNSCGEMDLIGTYDYHRCGEKIYNLHAYVRSNNILSFINGTWQGNTRNDLEAGLPNIDMRVNQNGDTIRHRLLVCAMNLEYYLVDQFGTGMGPYSYSEHQSQRTKISKALAKINADIYGLVEIQQGNGALKEIADDLTKNTGRPFTYIASGTSINGSYTQSGFVYCTETVEPYAAIQNIETAVKHRKKMQAFVEKSSGEKFIVSINHFKAKSGSGSGLDADYGQGCYNHTRTQEAQAVLDKYDIFRRQLRDSNVLFMGDLNAYAQEDPIRLFTQSKYAITDLHRYFHADSSYSYMYGGRAGYLDHALCDSTMLPQVTGMIAYHINSDESDQYTYDRSSDKTMFRCSDHDPIVVGLNLGKHSIGDTTYQINLHDVLFNGQDIIIKGALGDEGNTFYALYTLSGQRLAFEPITTQTCTISRPSAPGVYVLNVYFQNKVKQYKLIID
ncbi:MAG: T9SS type A sorting domain-containing protein [Paludibacteraceae bacterium]|nr:T9SS type A sorting domain-containing protein [Paludibacteraceae bacterium]